MPSLSWNDMPVSCSARFLGPNTAVLTGDVLEVTPNGLCLGLDAELERGRVLHLEFELPTGHVAAMGEVRWAVEKQGRVELGIRFVGLSPESLGVITSATA